MAQFYGVHNMQALPPYTVAALAVGLPDNSRVVRAITGAKIDRDTMLLAIIADRLGVITWMLSDSKSKSDIPPSLLDMLTERKRDESDNSQVEGFDSIEEFEARRQEILGGG